MVSEVLALDAHVGACFQQNAARDGQLVRKMRVAGAEQSFLDDIRVFMS